MLMRYEAFIQTPGVRYHSAIETSKASNIVCFLLPTGDQMLQYEVTFATA